MFVVVGGGVLLEISVLGEVRVVVVSNLFSNLAYNPYMFQWLPPTLYHSTVLGFLLLLSTSFTFVQTYSHPCGCQFPTVDSNPITELSEPSVLSKYLIFHFINTR